MNTDDAARCEEIERRLQLPLPSSFCFTDREDLRFLLDIVAAEAKANAELSGILSDLLNDRGMARLDALLAEAERRAALKCREMFVKYDGFSARHAARDITAAFKLPPLE